MKTVPWQGLGQLNGLPLILGGTAYTFCIDGGVNLCAPIFGLFFMRVAFFVQCLYFCNRTIRFLWFWTSGNTNN